MTFNPVNKAQFSAPETSIFVSANAGSGKTTLLTNRVLSLLCHGVRPERLLCLTYTNAAAAEMKSRIITALGGWVMKDDEELQANLTNLLGRSQNAEELAKARGLFASVLDAPEGLHIHTLHGFCQSLLKRFPLEAKLSPHFEIIESATQKSLLSEALQQLYQQATHDADLGEALGILVNHCSDGQLRSLLQEIITHKRKFNAFLGADDQAERKLFQILRIDHQKSAQELFDQYFSYTDQERKQLAEIASSLAISSSKNDQKHASKLSTWLTATDQHQLLIEDYRTIYFKTDGTLREVLFTKSALKDAALIEAFLAEQERVRRFDEEWKSQNIAVVSKAAHMVAVRLLASYNQLKSWRAALDYDDLIDHTCKLLDGAQMVPWVLFKLDGGIDHLMIDEAQDTSPEQWRIVSKLSEEFFAGQGHSKEDRSLFIVGDEKQSIYSFQGADVAALAKMQRYFAERINHARKPIIHLSLEYSYRSTPQLLQFVDSVYSNSAARDGLTFADQPLQHLPTREGAAGFIMQWPLIRASDDDYLSSALLLARQIASQISNWLEQGLWLDSKKRAIRPGDIMILVRQRSVLVDHLVRALKRAHIPVAGTDRMQLLDNLAVQDLLALGRFALLPEDNLNLAALLKSPLCNLSEDDLLTLCIDRGQQTIWQRLQEFQGQKPYHQIFEYLSELRARVDYSSPYVWYSYALETKSGRRKILGRMGQEYTDVIDEFLDQALSYEREQTASMQGFLHWLETSKGEIKRDMEQGHDVVRILTVHAAKGLQAPLVILPDTVEVPKPSQKELLLWADELPLLSLSSSEDNERCKELRQHKKQASYAEYRRLLYVALTRAEDHLLVAGHTGRKEISEESWYHHTNLAMKQMGQSIDTPPGVGYCYGEVRLSDAAQIVALETKPISKPAFLDGAVPLEPLPTKPLVPSRLSDLEPAAASPLHDAKHAARGQLIHGLLQRLPMIETTNWQETAMRIAASFQELSAPEREQAIKEVIAVLNHQSWSFLFGRDSIAEASIVGSVNVAGRPIAVAGRMDRLVVMDQDVWLVDYKTSLNPPQSASYAPKSYLRQLLLYKLLLKQIYPEKQIRTVLLWTSVPEMMPIDEALLDESLLSSYI